LKKHERILAGWILIQDSLGTPPTHRQFIAIASSMLPPADSPQPLGKHWLEGSYHDTWRLGPDEEREPTCFMSMELQLTGFEDFFPLLHHQAIRSIPPRCRYNMDETGIIERVSGNGLVPGSSRKRYTFVKQSGSRNLITCLEAISAAGEALPPLIVFKGKLVHQWFHPQLEQFKPWFFTASEKGWTNNEIAVAWLEIIFIPLTKPEMKTKRLLILDGYGSHTTNDFMIKCFQNDIFILFLP
jgi:4-hydroxybenzoate polyprenyltransferase